MSEEKKIHPQIKSNIHPRNKHRERYDFNQLKKSCPELTPFVIRNKFNDESINFSDPAAVRMLNSALLKHFYQIEHWSIPENYLCPPIPGRADYIHHIADLLATLNQGIIPKGEQIRCLDVGVGASCIYPILGNKEYGWSFVGSDVDVKSVDFARNTITANADLQGKIEIRQQYNAASIFTDIIQRGESFDLTICNPPFHRSKAEANEGTLRKLSNLKKGKVSKKVLNFGGQSNELWCKGGELGFVKTIIAESQGFKHSCLWFSSLISKESNLKPLYDTLKIAGAKEVKTIQMGQGNKISRIVAWTYLKPEQQKEWVSKNWMK